MKNYKWLIYLSIIIAFGLFAGVYMYSGKNAGKPAETPPQANLKSTKPLIDERGGIQVVAFWVNPDPNSPQQKFQLQLNNHMWDFNDYYFKDNITFKLNGEEISSSVISEDRRPDGHHLVSEVIIESPEFSSMKEGDELSLIVNSIEGTPERVFTWSY